MPKKDHKVTKQLRDNFLNRMKSVHNKMSRGAENIWRMIKCRVNFGQKGSGNTNNRKKHPSLKRPR